MGDSKAEAQPFVPMDSGAEAKPSEPLVSGAEAQMLLPMADDNQGKGSSTQTQPPRTGRVARLSATFERAPPSVSPAGAPTPAAAPALPAAAAAAPAALADPASDLTVFAEQK